MHYARRYNIMKDTTKQILMMLLKSDETISNKQFYATMRILEDKQLAEIYEPEPIKAPLLLNMGEAAKYLGVSRPTLWRMIKAGALEKVQITRNSYRLRKRDIEKLVMKENKKQLAV